MFTVTIDAPNDAPAYVGNVTSCRRVATLLWRVARPVIGTLTVNQAPVIIEIRKVKP